MATKCNEHSALLKGIEIHDTRLGSHGQQLDTINETLAALKEIEKQNQERIDNLDKRLADLESVPKQRWNSVVNYLLTALLGIVAGVLAGHFGSM